MSAPSLIGLPPPPEGRTGWPWTADAVALPALRAGARWPSLTLVTPSYMQGRYLEQTIRSVLLQGYPQLEYFVLDGGSTDESRQIIDRYRPWLAGSRSAKDGGQTATINEGWDRGHGTVLAWLNSDDWYHPGALAAALRLFAEDEGIEWVAGGVDDCTASGDFLKRHPAGHMPLAQCLGRNDFHFYQPGMFWARSLRERVGALDAGLHYAFDHDFWTRCLVNGATLHAMPEPVACFRRHTGSKTLSSHEEFLKEDWEVFNRYAHLLHPDERRKSRRWLEQYEADLLSDVVYRLLSENRHGEARRHLLARRGVLRHLPRKFVAGMIWRTFVTRRPAPWFEHG